MLLLYTQPYIQADATGIFILAVIVGIFVIPPIVKKSKISEAENLKNNYPDGYRKVCGSIYYIDYKNAKKIVDKSYLIISAQREFDEEKKKAELARLMRVKANELRRTCPYATKGKTDEEIAHNEYSIRADEKIHSEREARAKKILQDNPKGVNALYGYISAYGSMSDEDIDKLINTEYAIRDKQKECEANDNELKKLAPQLNELKKKYPLAVGAICTEKKWSTSNAEHVKLLLLIPGELAEKQEQRERVLLNSSERLAPIVKKAKELVAKGDKSRAKSYISQSYGDRVADRVMKIIASEEEFQEISKHLDSIAKCQNDFAQETRNIIPDVFNGWGWYKYSFEMEFLDDNSNVKTNTLTVWQAFCESCCFDDTVSYEFYPRKKENRVSKSQLESGYFYKEPIWDKVMSFISRLKDKYGDELFVILANTDHLEEKAFDVNYKYVKTQLQMAGIRHSESILSETTDSPNRKYVVIDIITENSNLKQYCSSLFHHRHIMRIKSNQGTTGVVFITMLKCFDGAELEELNRRKVKEQEDAERKAREEEERKQKEQRDISEAKSIAQSFTVGFSRYFPNVPSYSIDASQARSIIQKKSAIREYEDTISHLRGSVSGWDTVRGVPHYFFYYYYPTRFTDISADSRDARRLVYNFKDGVAHNKVKDLVVEKIRSTFRSSDISKLCFACIPASTRSVNQARYEAFSNEVCQALGMADAYDYITITKEKTPAHLGGDDSAEYSYNKSFFNGKFVVLFDDIVTRGGSVASMKNELEAIGAVVICAISIGRTFSDWNGNTPRPHPYTGRI